MDGGEEGRCGRMVDVAVVQRGWAERVRMGGMAKAEENGSVLVERVRHG